MLCVSVKNIDRNNDGMIDFDEFIEAATNRMHLLNEEENLRMAFNFLDANKDGSIDINEIKQALGKGKSIKSEIDSGHIDESFWTEMIQVIDKDGDGEIDFEEFRDHMLQMIQKGDYDIRATVKAQN